MLLKLMLFSKESQLLPNWVLCEWQFITERKAGFWATATVLYLTSTDHTCLCTEWSAVWHQGSGFHVPAPKRPRGDLESFSLLCTEQQFEFLWHQQKFRKQQQCEALKRAVCLMKQLNRQLQSTWINSAYIKKISQQQFPLDAGSLSPEFSGVWAICYISQQFILWLEQAVVNCTINGIGCHCNSHHAWGYFASISPD